MQRVNPGGKQAPAQPPQTPLVENSIHFHQAQAIVWQIKFIVNQINSKKMLTQATIELENLADSFGKDFDKYLLKELIEQIDLKDPIKAQKDKNEPFKVTLLNTELTRCSTKPEFLLYFNEIAQQSFTDRYADFLSELTKRLRLNFPNQLLVALSLAESCREDSLLEAMKILKQKLIDYHNYGKPEPLPEYAVHRLLFLLQTQPELNSDDQLREIIQYIIDSNSLKPSSHLSLRTALQPDLTQVNCSVDEPSIGMLKEGNGLDFLDKSCKMLEPWQLLNDLGHYCSYNYNFLLKTLEDFKDMTEKSMARTLLHLSANHSGYDDQYSRIVTTIFEANKKGGTQNLKKDVGDKKTPVSWSVDNLARAFRELYSNLSWPVVFQSLSEIEDEIAIDAKAFSTFLQIFNKSKPQNVQFPQAKLLDLEWKNAQLQISFIEHSIQLYIDKKEKLFQFRPNDRRQELIEDITGIRDKVSIETLQIWTSVDLVERLIHLSDSHYYTRVRHIFEAPMKQMPEYLLLTLSLCVPKQGTLMIDELLSLLLPQFLGNHINSIPVLQALWRNNQALMIRGVCELCRHDQRIMNLSRVLDITQEVKESLIPIVNCEDYYFAVNLGILAGKRDFLHYDVWLQGRIQDVGTPFIKALLKYIKEHIITPIIEYQKKHTNPQNQQLDVSADQLELHKQQVLERSHLSKEKLCITMEHLSNPINQTKIQTEINSQIREVVTRLGEFFPNQFSQAQNSEEIDNAANDYFQKVFSAEAHQVDTKITELIETMQKFKESDIKKEQEIYACMLHSLFDEYRFLHRYPQPYLEKIAKLFGAIIKYRIIDGTLQDIALKFAFEAFRREGKRQKFGVITIKQFFDMLPQFPQFFEDIYEIRTNIQQTDPSMIREIEDLYERTMKRGLGQEPEPIVKKEEEKESKSKQQEKKIAEQIQNISMPKINQSEFLNAFQQNTSRGGTQQNEPASLRTTQSAPQQQQQQQTAQTKPPTVQAVDNSSSRASTPIQPQSQLFIPSYRTRPQQQPEAQQTVAANQPAQMPDTSQTGLGLNVQSAAFRRVPPKVQTPSQPQVQIQQPPPQLVQPQVQQQYLPPPPQQQVRAFKPVKSPAPNSELNKQFTQMQQQIDTKLQKAVQENAKIRLEDIVEDSNLPGPNPDGQEAIKFICNNTGKNNFNIKLEELKTIINQNAPVNLNWFIHYVLTKRINISQQQSNLHLIYIDLIKNLGLREAVPLTIQQTVDLFKKCMLVDEELINRVILRPQAQGSLIKQYLVNLGAFMGCLTLAHNRPILAKELDIKQLLVEGFASDKLKYVITFVCRILKECQKSHVFKHTNPWLRANLEILREIYEWAFTNNINSQNQHGEILMEIDALSKSLGISNINEIQHAGFLKASQTQQYLNSNQQVEIMHMSNKNQLIPAVQPLQPPQTQQQQTYQRPPAMSPLPLPGGVGGYSMFQPQPQRLNTLGQNDYPGSSSTQQTLIHTQAQIFPRVVVSPDLQSMLASKTPKDQLLRKLVAEAVDSSIVEILPPVVDRSVTIALITTRELVLKDFAYDGDFTKILKAADLIVQNLAGSLALVTCREPLKMSLTQNLKRAMAQQLNAALQQEGEQILNETQITDIAQLASKENLELGCKLIKKSVIQKALTKVREDQAIMRAIDARKHAQGNGQPHFQDDQMVASFRDLPPQLQPNQSGLTDAQFQVYEDFGRLQNRGQSGSSNQENPNQRESNTIETILKLFERQLEMNEFIEYQLGQKLKQLNTAENGELAEEVTKLWAYVQKWFNAVCDKFDQPQEKESLNVYIEGLQFIVSRFKVEDLQKKLTQQFLSLDNNIVHNCELTLTLFKKNLLSLPEWDQQIAFFLRDTQQFQLQEPFFTFVRDFFDHAIQKQKLFNYHQFPNTMPILEKLSENPYIGKLLNKTLEDLKAKGSWNKETLKDYFNEWAVISFEESYPKQEQEVNRFFNNLQSMGLYKDQQIMYNFCKVMVEQSIERAIQTVDGQKRPADRLVYRYIESFLKLIIVLLKTSDINKHEFMSNLFEVIHEVLDDDHKTKRIEFNQKPYYRLLINILTAVNNSQFFNPKTHLLILFSLADLFNKLNPNKYPAFSFAWLELISHKQFMPHFLQTNQQPQAQKSSRGQNAAPNQQQTQDNNSLQKWFKFKELIVNLFTFLKSNMIVGQKLSPPLAKFYEATLRIIMVIKHDYPEFLCDFHFNFVNSLPDHCIQIKNIILSAQPRNIPMYNPFSRNLKVDTIQEITLKPRMQSNYDNYLSFMNIREDLEKYIRTKAPQLIQIICDKMMQSEEIINGRRKINSCIINAVALFIGNFALQQQTSQKECYDMFKKIMLNLNNETRLCLLNSLVNELRYINSYTYFYSWIVIFLFSDNDELIQEQITRILIERLQCHEPHPWGLSITFRELLQNPKYLFARKSFVIKNQEVIEHLLQTKLHPFYNIWQNQKQQSQQPATTQPQQQPNMQAEM